MKQYAVYILECHNGSYHVEVTNDLERRLLEHNTGKVGPKERSKLYLKRIGKK